MSTLDYNVVTEIQKETLNEMIIKPLNGATQYNLDKVSEEIVSRVKDKFGEDSINELGSISFVIPLKRNKTISLNKDSIKCIDYSYNIETKTSIYRTKDEIIDLN